MNKPHVIVFDVNETLSDMAPMGQRFRDAGAPEALAPLWFARLLRDGFALAAAGSTARFSEIGTELLTGMLRDTHVAEPADTAAALTTALADLPLHPDVADAVRALRAAGYRLVTLTNGSAQVAQQLFDTAGIRDEFDQLLSVEDAPAWKPHPAAYAYAAEHCNTTPENMLLIAVHPWDIHGAAQAGLQTAWLNRDQSSYPSYFRTPDHEAASLTDLASALT